jgi:hypothetical protein
VKNHSVDGVVIGQEFTHRGRVYQLDWQNVNYGEWITHPTNTTYIASLCHMMSHPVAVLLKDLTDVDKMRVATQM